MWKALALLVGGVVLYEIYAKVASLRRNIALAKASGFPYLIVPLPYLEPQWLVVQRPVLKMLYRLPKSWRGSWVDHIDPMQTHLMAHGMFEKVDGDLLLLVTPSVFYLQVADAEFSAEVIQRRNDFGKPLWNYRVLDLYGKNIVTTEGQYWRHQRRIVAPPFNESNNHLVWSESLLQAQNLMQSVTGPDGSREDETSGFSKDMMRVALYVISKAGFGRDMQWPGIKMKVADSRDKITIESEKQRSMTYTTALDHVARSIMVLVAFPPFVLRYAPFNFVRTAWTAKQQWGAYMEDMCAQKQRELSEPRDPADGSAGLDLLSGLIRASGGENGSQALLSQEEILGNAFIILVAGHESTANTMFFALVYLAMNVPTQRRVQAEIESVFGDRPMGTWSYDDDMPRLFGSLIGATMNETLRLVPAVAMIPKWTPIMQKVTVGEREYVIPPRTVVCLGTYLTHLNPKYWPHGPPRDPHEPENPRCNLDNDLSEFKPERWLLEGYDGPAARGDTKGMGAADQGTRTAEADDLHINTAADTANTFFKPAKGAYMPFSDGARACLGRRFAQTEFLAVMSVILRTWRVELGTNEWASDEEVEKMDDARKREVWEKARRAAKNKLYEDMTALITVQLRPGVTIPLRFVKRGKERFDWR